MAAVQLLEQILDNVEQLNIRLFLNYLPYLKYPRSKMNKKRL